MRIGIVGPCTSGKTTLVQALRELDYEVRHIAQEHSYVADMWQRLSKPDILVYLDVSFPVALQRRRMDWTPGEHQTQVERLRHARQHATLYIQTDELTPKEVLAQVLDFIQAL